MDTFKRLLAFARTRKSLLALTIIIGLTGGLLTIWQAASLSHLIDGVFLGGLGLVLVLPFFRLLLVIIFLRAALTWAGEVTAKTIALSVKRDLRRLLFDHLLALGPAYTRTEQTGELANTLTEGVEALDAYFSQYLPQLVIAALVPFSILLVVFPRDLLSGVILLLTAPLIPVFMVLIGKTAESLTHRQWGSLSRLGAHFLESLQGLTTLKELGRSREQADSISRTSERFRDITLKVLRVTFLSALVLELVSTISTALIAVEVGLRLLYGHLGFQPALFLLLLAPEFYLPLRMLGLRFHAGMSGTAAARRIFEILDIKQQLGQQPDLIHPHPLQNFSNLRIANLSFTYPGKSGSAISCLDMELKRGDHIALVGPTGAGKSTLVAVLLGFLHPDSGEILVDGKPIEPFSPSWQGSVAWVSQNPYLFHDTLEANLRLARPDASCEELDSALCAARLDSLVNSLHLGMATVLGEEGARLSSGEAQRLAIARAFLSEAPLVILDEPTSNLDPANEAALESAIASLEKGRAVLTVAHRLNTIARADRIYVMQSGRIVESGSHGSLLAAGGLYAAMVSATVEAPEAEPSPVGLPVDPWPTASLPSYLVHGSSLSAWSVFRRLLGFLKGSWGWVALSVLLGVLTVGSNVGLMGTSAFLISMAALHPAIGVLQVAIVGVRFFGLSRGVFRYTERLASHNVTFRLLARLRTWFYRAMEPLAPARLIQFRSGDLLARIIADVDTLESFFVRAVAPPAVAIIVSAGMCAWLAVYGSSLALVYFFFMLLVGLVLPLLFWIASRRVGEEMVRGRSGLYARLVDGLRGLPELIAFGCGASYAGWIDSDGVIFGHSQAALAFMSGLSGGLTLLAVNMGTLAVLAFSIPLVISGRLSGIMLAVLALAAMAGFEAVMPLPLTAQVLSSSAQAARRLFEVVDVAPAVSDAPSVFAPLKTLPAMKITGLSFTYPGESLPALAGIDLSLPPGKHLVLLGPSGAGKSTLFSLLLRFWEVGTGTICLDGHDFHEVSQEDVRCLFSSVLPRSFFFNLSIRQNLLLASPSASDAEIHQAARFACIDEFVDSLPRGLDTVIGERGLRLSGGERQRLALARAFLKDAPIFLLDEPFAGIDPLTARRLLGSLLDLPRRHSMILITHRLAGLDQMDEIVVLDQGRIVERGHHSELLAAGGWYARMVELERRILPAKITP